MRPARMTIVALAGMIALHVFMLAGHGRGHDVGMGDAHTVAAHAGSPTSPSVSAPMPADQDAAAMGMTVACLAVLAGLLLLPARSGLLATVAPGRLTAIGHSAHPERAGPRTRSLTELCISLT